MRLVFYTTSLLPQLLLLRDVQSMSLPTRRFPYQPPAWASAFQNPPKHGRLRLANLPTPLYQLPVLPQPQHNHTDANTTPHNNSFLHTLQSLNTTLYIKRDDGTGGVELGGNKIRKLEFLLADALAQGCDSVVTIGGIQSNHCRATATAARMLNLEPHLILRRQTISNSQDESNHRTNDVAADDDDDIGLVGNLLLDRLVGSTIYSCTPGEYGRVGSTQLVERVAVALEHQGRRPYRIPVGGSNAIGTWGYLQAVQELFEQWTSEMEHKPSLDHIVFACGSGGTACGIALGVALAFRSATTMPHVHAVGVCDDPDYFYKFVAGIAQDMQFVPPDGSSVEDFVRKHMTVHQGKGKGYAVSTHGELEFIAGFARWTGIALDPVYSGKALYNFMLQVDRQPQLYRDKTVLFWHTGGALGLYDKLDDLTPTITASSPCIKLDVYGKGVGLDISQSVNDKI
jgi:D-cysteine desulfhydrase